MCSRLITAVDLTMSAEQQKRIEGPLADGRVGSRIENYTGFWDKDTSKESEGSNANRLDSYTDVVNGTTYLVYSFLCSYTPSQATTMVPPSSTSTAGHSPSTSRDSIRARLSPPPLPATSTTSPPPWPSSPACASSTSAAVSAALPARSHDSRT
jgi:hypothetical protein